MAQISYESDGTGWFALRLEQLYPVTTLRQDVGQHDAVAFLITLEAHDDARFVIQTSCWPNKLEPERGRISVSLLVGVVPNSDQKVLRERIEELCDDLCDLLGAPPRRWAFVPVDCEEELQSLLDPILVRSVAEVARREEPCGSTGWSGGLGYASEAGRRALEHGLWSTWTFGLAAQDHRRLASVLLAQEAPVVIRTVLKPTMLTQGERSALEKLSVELGPELPAGGLLRSSLNTLESLLYLRPLFEIRCLVASTERLSRSLLSALGHSISEPAPHAGSQPILSGGYAVMRDGADGEERGLAAAFAARTSSTGPSTLALQSLRRVRYLLGPWEASNVFRVPVGDDEGLPGVETLSVPTLDPPASRLPPTGVRIGALVGHGGLPVRIGVEERFRHLYLMGQTGTGKSTLLLNLIMQDIDEGKGVAVLDPHGDLVEEVLGRIPDERVNEVIVIDPADPIAVVGVNLLEAESAVQAEYIVEELSAMFYALFDPNNLGIVGPRFETMLRQAANLLLASPESPSSLLDIVTVFTDPAVRSHLVKNIFDPILAEYWLGEMQMPRSNEWQEVMSWFRSKFEIFRTSRLVRNVVGQSKSTVSFHEILSNRQILLVNLSKGQLGEYNSALIGHVIFAKLWSAALERATVPVHERPDFHIYIDEFQNVTSDSLPIVLSEARKFRVGLTLANQFFSQVRESTRDAIMGNVASRVTFRIGPKDALLFSEWLGREVSDDDLTSLPNFMGIGSLTVDGVPLPPFALRTDAAVGSYDEERAEEVRAASRAQWARSTSVLDDEFFSRWRHIDGSISAKAAAAAHQPQRPKRSSQEDFLAGWIARHAGKD